MSRNWHALTRALVTCADDHSPVAFAPRDEANVNCPVCGLIAERDRLEAENAALRGRLDSALCAAAQGVRLVAGLAIEMRDARQPSVASAPERFEFGAS